MLTVLTSGHISTAQNGLFSADVMLQNNLLSYLLISKRTEQSKLYFKNPHQVITHYETIKPQHKTADLQCPQVHFSLNQLRQFSTREWKKIHNLVDSSQKLITPKVSLQTYTRDQLVSQTSHGLKGNARKMP